MVSILLVAGLMAVLVMLVWFVASFAKQTGTAQERSRIIEEIEKGRERFRESLARPIASGGNLLRRLRRLGNDDRVRRSRRR